MSKIIVSYVSELFQDTKGNTVKNRKENKINQCRTQTSVELKAIRKQYINAKPKKQHETSWGMWE